VVVCLEQCADLHVAQLMLLPLTVFCLIEFQMVLLFWYRLTWVVPDKGPLNGCVCVCTLVLHYISTTNTAGSLTAGTFTLTFRLTALQIFRENLELSGSAVIQVTKITVS